MLLFLLITAQCIAYLLFPCRGRSGYLACGIAGFNGKPDQPVDSAKYKFLLYLNESRGKDSTGIFTVGTDKKRTQGILKDVGTAQTMIQRSDFGAAVQNAHIVTGHTRQATVGSVSKVNAHPFEYGDINMAHTIGDKSVHEERIIGVHNGFVIQDITSKWVGHGKMFPKAFDVDSQLIFALLAYYGGDYNILPEIEGGITIAYNMPDKYPGITFLYRRSARSLFIGKAKEGMYFSSEELPLKLIGCTMTNEVPANDLLLLKDGEIYDLHKMQPPKIKSIPLGASRFNCLDTIPTDELEAYPGLKKSAHVSHPSRAWDSSTGTGGNGRTNSAKKDKKDWSNIMTMDRGRSPAGGDSTFEEDDELMTSLIKETQEEVKHIAPTTIPPDHTESEIWENGEYDAGILIVKLLNSNDYEPLPGFLVFDKTDETIANPTALNGVMALRYKPVQCDVDRELVIVDPCNGSMKFSYKFKPRSGWVHEVTLQLPFPQGQEPPEGSSGSESEGITQKLINAGAAGLNLLPSNVKLHANILSPAGSHQEILRGEGEHIHRQPTAEEVLGDSVSVHTGKDRTVHDASESPFRNGTRAGKSVKMLTRAGIDDIIDNEYKTFNLKGQIKKMFFTPDYTSWTRKLTLVFKNMFVIGQLMHDACLLKLFIHEKFGNSMSIGFYAIALMDLRIDKYLYRKLTDADMIVIRGFVENFNLGRINIIDTRPYKQGDVLKSVDELQQEVASPEGKPLRQHERHHLIPRTLANIMPGKPKTTYALGQN